MTKPLLFLDVDGVVNPFLQIKGKRFDQPRSRGRSYVWELKHVRPASWEQGQVVLVSEEQGSHIAELADTFNIIWCTAWNEDANRCISPLLGLPRLPVLSLPADAARYDWKRDAGHRGSWKALWVARWLEDYGWHRVNGTTVPLPWAWIDDEVNNHDRAYLQQRWANTDLADAQFKLVPTQADAGLTHLDLRTVRRWGQSVT